MPSVKADKLIQAIATKKTMIRGKALKLASAFLAVNFLAQVVYPTVAVALTGGPSQPEVQSFEPVGTTQMVDLSTGDFNYNIPLLTVPGPNGGYPINMAYHAGIGMEQEASWVGLGWNINPGAITRNMRGLPDDFNGDNVVREMNLKPNVTIGFGIDATNSNASASSDEIFGLPLQSSSYQIYHNNYRGLGYRTGLNLAVINQEGLTNTDKQVEGIAGSANLTFDSQSGLSFSPSLSYGKKGENRHQLFNITPNFHSRQGFQGIKLKYDNNPKREETTTDDESTDAESTPAMPDASRKVMALNHTGVGAGVSFGYSTYVPGIQTPMRGLDFRFSVEPGRLNLGNFQEGDVIKASYSEQRVRETTQNLSAYGMMHLENRQEEDDAIMDFNREKDVAISKRNPSAPMPIRTHDMFMIKGQGIGGVFRPYRSDIGFLSQDVKESKSHTVSGGIEFSTPGPNVTSNQLGVDFAYGYTESYDGDWRQQRQQLDYLDFQGEDPNNPLYEPVYFKANGEHTASDPGILDDLGGTDPLAFNLDLKWTNFSAKPRVKKNYTGDAPYSIQNSTRTDREIRSQHIAYRTKAEVIQDASYTDRPDNILPENQYPFPYTNIASKYNHASIGSDDHIHEVTVVNPDGTKYIYGIPAYNKKHDNVAFANASEHNPGPDNTHGQPDKYSNPRSVSYNSGSASVNNEDGEDRFYSRTSLPEYAHSYLITEVLSTDYVDLTGDGPSDDDFGYWCKFNYTEYNDYKWRIPYRDADYTKGSYSNTEDDRGSYVYGEKDIFYVNSIETRTHIAVFELADRRDSKGAPTEYNVGAGTGDNLKCLKSITLYSKKDPAIITGNGTPIPIKKVHFEYDYKLCGNVANNDGLAEIDPITGDDLNEQKGKLTLRKVFFTHLGNEKGKLSPYEFEYNGDGVGEFDYDLLQMDRWGNYQPDDPNDYLVNTENPYTYQDAAYAANDIDNNMSAWCLNTIHLPSGGDITVEYEADDYQYVQDKQAMQMMKILGTSNVNDPVASPNNLSVKLRKNFLRIYFELEQPTSDPAEVAKYVEDMEYVQFKTWQRLKRENPSIIQTSQLVPDWAYDYVTGYAKIDHSAGTTGLAAGSNTVGYFTVEKVGYNKPTGSTFDAHPFRRAGWQYLRYSRPDLFITPFEPQTPLPTFVYNAISIIIEAVSLLIGFYNRAAMLGYNSEIELSMKPSFVRLNSTDGIKYGGGHRVSRVAITDNWSEVEGNDAMYGQEYDYSLLDGTSAGVADYEPLIGGEENPLRQPIWYNGNQNDISFRHRDAFIEEPYGETFYPGANVVYSRVKVNNLTHDPNVTKSQGGITIHEFYTSKDFPVMVTPGELKHKGYNLPIILPFIGSQNFHNNGYSQGYVVELNDMSGKPKAVSTYPFTGDLTAQPVIKTEYIYHTDPNNGKKLSNLVTVLDDDGSSREALLGQTHDFYIDDRQHSSFSTNLGLQANLMTQSVLILFTAVPSLELSESMFRSIVTNKVINRTGILKETRTFADGAQVVASNLMFDAETGSPLLTSLTNEWHEPVYTYNYAAHWAYDGMGPAYQNQGAAFDIISASNGLYPLSITASADLRTVFYPGDEVAAFDGTNWNVFYVTDVDASSFRLENTFGTAVGTSAANKPGRIWRSGRRNQQSIPSGTIVSLENPVTAGTLAVLGHYNDLLADLQGNSNNIIDASYTDCNGQQFRLEVEKVNGLSQITFSNADENCQAFIDLLGQNLPGPLSSYEVVSFDRSTGQVVLENSQSGTQYSGVWNDPNECFGVCFDVLHAIADQFSDDIWQYNYTDVGDPLIDNGQLVLPISQASAAGNLNEHRFGQRGIWRSERKHLYQVDRQQEGQSPTFLTRADQDGEYESFVPFDWSSGGSNPNWDWATRITRYSPFGYKLESQSRLGMYSSELYGYCNSVVTATSTNSLYTEVAFDGFEDYDLTLNPLSYGSHGHLNLIREVGGPIEISDQAAHTGDYSLELGDPGPAYFEVDLTNPDRDYFVPVAGKKYVFSCWVKNGTGLVEVIKDGLVTSSFTTAGNGEQPLDGWRRLEGEFSLAENQQFPGQFVNSSFRLRFIGTDNNEIYFDDIRISPFVGSMISFVYDPITLRLVAELDNFNYATFYSYDEEGSLVQVKKETKDGILTLSTTRQNLDQSRP